MILNKTEGDSGIWLGSLDISRIIGRRGCSVWVFVCVYISESVIFVCVSWFLCMCVFDHYHRCRHRPHRKRATHRQWVLEAVLQHHNERCHMYPGVNQLKKQKQRHMNSTLVYRIQILGIYLHWKITGKLYVEMREKVEKLWFRSMKYLLFFSFFFFFQFSIFYFLFLLVFFLIFNYLFHWIN